jgi:hypothetical protein
MPRVARYLPAVAACSTLALLSLMTLVPSRAAAGDYLYIGGSPQTSIVQGRGYVFQPWLSTPRASKPHVVFSVRNKPYWASFDTRTGRLSGMVRAAQVGNYRNILISASDGRAHATMPSFSISVTASGGSPAPAPSPGDTAPTISGTPRNEVTVGSAYSFQPTASDANGDKLTFSASKLPAWASFNTSTGHLSGTPTAANVGTTSNIVISVSDGKKSTSLPPFSITVAEVASGSATLAWTPPTTNTDGSQLTNLAGYIISYGTSAGSLTHSVQISNPGIADYVITNLTPGTWYFDIQAFNQQGTHSSVSKTVSTQVN